MPRVKQTARKSTALKRPSAEPSACDFITSVDELRRFTRSKSVSAPPRLVFEGGTLTKIKRGKGAQREIQRLQRTSELIIPYAPFRRLVRDVATEVLIKKAKAKKEKPATVKFQAIAVKALQEASEAFLVGIFEDSNLLAIHCGRVTVTPRDVNLIRRLRGEDRFRL